MDETQELKAKVSRWADRIGRAKAKRLMFGAGIGYSTADALVRGVYFSKPGEGLKKKITSAMAKAPEQKAA